MNRSYQENNTSIYATESVITDKKIATQDDGGKRLERTIVALLIFIALILGFSYHTRYGRAINNHEFQLVETSDPELMETIQSFNEDGVKVMIEFKHHNINFIVDDAKVKFGKYKINGNKIRIDDEQAKLSKNKNTYQFTYKDGTYFKDRKSVV